MRNSCGCKIGSVSVLVDANPMYVTNEYSIIYCALHENATECLRILSEMSARYKGLESLYASKVDMTYDGPNGTIERAERIIKTSMED